MIQNGGGMAQFGQMGLNQFSQMLVPQVPIPMMMGGYGPMGGMYPMPIMPQPLMPPQGGQGQFQQQGQIPQQGYMQMQGPNQNSYFEGGGSSQAQQGQGEFDDVQKERSLNQNQSQSSIPISKPSGGFQENDRYSKAQKQKEYSQMLSMQLEQKKQKKNELMSYEEMQIEKLRQERMQKNEFLTQGQITRDFNGHIQNTRGNPGNPNYQAQDWFSHAAHKDEIANQLQGRQNHVPSYNQSVPDLSNYDLDLRRQRQMEQRQQTTNTQNVDLNQEKIQRAQDAFQKATPQINMPEIPQVQASYQFGRPNGLKIGGESEEQKQRKRQDALDLQREQLEQIEEKKRQRELKQLQEKRERELEDLKIERERQEIEQRIVGDILNQKKGHRNLHQTNIDNTTISQYAQQSSSEHQPVAIKSAMKKSTYDQIPDDGAAPAPLMASNYSQNRDSVQRKSYHALPAEITKQVKETLNSQLDFIRNEMNLQTNSLGEQLIGMKQQLMQVYERRNQAEENSKKLHEEIKKTQIIDEIRNKELYKAFANSNKPYSETLEAPGRLYNIPSLYDEEERNLELSSILKPPQSQRDTYLENYDFKQINAENDKTIQNSSKSIPLSSKFTPYQDRKQQGDMEEFFFYNTQEERDFAKKSLNIKTDAAFELSKDYAHRSDLFQGRNQNPRESSSRNHTGHRNLPVVDNLEEVDIYKENINLDKLDEALFDLAKHSQQEGRFKKRYEMEENLQDIEDYINFNSKLMRSN